MTSEQFEILHQDNVMIAQLLTRIADSIDRIPELNPEKKQQWNPIPPLSEPTSLRLDIPVPEDTQTTELQEAIHQAYMTAMSSDKQPKKRGRKVWIDKQPKHPK